MRPLPWVVALGVLALPAALGAQERVVRRSELQRLVPDSAARLRMLRLEASQVQTLSAGAESIRLDSGQALATRTGAAATRIRAGIRIPVSVQPVDTAPPPAPAPDVLPDFARPPEVGAGPEAPGGGVAGVMDAAEQLALPFSYVVASADGSQLLALRPVFVPRSRLRYDPGTGLFRGSFYLALQDTLHPASSLPLAAAVRLQLTSDADSLLPELLEVAHTNFPLQEISVAARQVGDSLRVRVTPEFDLRGVDVWLGAAPSLMLVSAAQRIAGFGIEGTAITIALRGGGGGGPVVVSLAADRGTIEPAQVQLRPGEAATVRVRSAGVGPATIRAVTANLGSEPITLRFTWPVLFLFAALVGGALGGLVVALQPGQARRRSRQRHVLLGTLSGFLAATVYYAIGLNLLGLRIDVQFLNEAAVFALAAVAGMVGIPVAGRLAGKPKTATTTER